jgi:hypothetical protein
MTLEKQWNDFLAPLRAAHDAHRLSFDHEKDRFREFVRSIAKEERIPLLIWANERYKALGPSEGYSHEHYFWSSSYGILISTLLTEKDLVPSDAQVYAILRGAFHYCGHGCDVDTPVKLAEKVFENRPYNAELFDSAMVYRETLRPLQSIASQNTKKMLDWMFWHDTRKPVKNCWTARIQSTLAGINPEEAFAWQWMLRHTAGGLNAAPGKSWLKEAEKRFKKLGESAFLPRLAAWFDFPENEPVRLTPVGSSMLRVLVWYAGFVDSTRTLPILVRVAGVQWAKRDPAQKVVNAVAWLLETRGDSHCQSAIEKICAEWAESSGAVQKLQALYLPEHAAKREAEQHRRLEEQRTNMDPLLKGVLALAGKFIPSNKRS